MVNGLPKLAIVTTHPIQYNAPLFRLLAERKKIFIKVFYTWSQARDGVYDPGFDHHRKWDIPLLDGYEFCFVENKAKHPGSNHFSGIKNPSLISLISEWKPDAVLVFGWSFRSHLHCLRYFKGRFPVFFRGDSTLLDEERGIKAWLRRAFLYWVYRHVDKAFYTGQNNKAYFLKHGLSEDQLVSARHAVDNQRFAVLAAKEAAAALRSSLGFQSNDFVLLFAGKLEEKKNPFYILRLAEKMPDPQFKFLLVGNGKLENDLKVSARDDERIRFLDFQNQSVMPAVYHAADCFILPSTGPGETWGLAANEAMACGLPVLLSSKVGGAIDLVKDNGLIFDPQDVESTKAYIFKIASDLSQLVLAKSNSLKRIRDFSFENIAFTLENELLSSVEKFTKIEKESCK